MDAWGNAEAKVSLKVRPRVALCGLSRLASPGYRVKQAPCQFLARRLGILRLEQFLDITRADIFIIRGKAVPSMPGRGGVDPHRAGVGYT